MRSESEMLDLILDTAQADERVRVVLLNGSQAQSQCPQGYLPGLTISSTWSTEPESFVATWAGSDVRRADDLAAAGRDVRHTARRARITMAI